VDLRSLVDDAIQMSQPAAQAKGVALRVDARQGGPMIVGDPARLQQILSNLLSNAIKFTPPGGSIEVAVRHQGTHAELSVADTGVGLKPELLSSVFDRFRQ